jgi:hypothetical protein
LGNLYKGTCVFAINVLSIISAALNVGILF